MIIKELGKISIFHSENLDTTYRVAEKPLPPDLPATYRGRRIRWLTNFGFTRKDSRAPVTGLLDEAYELEIDQDSDPASVLVCFDGRSVSELATRPSATAPGKVRATLNLGDPPIGWG